MSYEPELGQMIFGNPSAEYDLGDHEEYVASDIGRGMSANRELSRAEWREIFARCATSLIRASQGQVERSPELLQAPETSA